MIRTTLVTGGDTFDREQAISERINVETVDGVPVAAIAILFEGLSLRDAEENLLPVFSEQGVKVIRIAQNCFCCTGNLTMRVSLDRLLRSSPRRLYIAIASIGHIEALRRFLSAAPYHDRLFLTDDLQI